MQSPRALFRMCLGFSLGFSLGIERHSVCKVLERSLECVLFRMCLGFRYISVLAFYRKNLYIKHTLYRERTHSVSLSNRDDTCSFYGKNTFDIERTHSAEREHILYILHR
jgi:hypothetical protein